MKNFNLLEQVITEFGFTPEEVVKNWLQAGKIKLSDFEATEKSEPKSSQPLGRRITPGMYVYDDGLITEEIIPGRKITSVVGAIIGHRVLSVCLRETKLPWSSNYLKAGTEEVSSGREATQKIMAAAREQSKKAEAAEWCFNYTEDGVRAGEAFLPTMEEWKAVYANKSALNNALRQLGVDELKGWYWSSTEGSSSYSWILNLLIANNDYYDKNYGSYVRAMLTFEI